MEWIKMVWSVIVLRAGSELCIEGHRLLASKSCSADARGWHRDDWGGGHFGWNFAPQRAVGQAGGKQQAAGNEVAG